MVSDVEIRRTNGVKRLHWDSFTGSVLNQVSIVISPIIMADMTRVDQLGPLSIYIQVTWESMNSDQENKCMWYITANSTCSEDEVFDECHSDCLTDYI